MLRAKGLTNNGNHLGGVASHAVVLVGDIVTDSGKDSLQAEVLGKEGDEVPTVIPDAWIRLRQQRLHTSHQFGSIVNKRVLAVGSDTVLGSGCGSRVAGSSRGGETVDESEEKLDDVVLTL